MKIMVPPIKCQGIKTKLVPIIRDAVQLNGAGIWIEAFTGSEVGRFNMMPRNAVFADTNLHLINFYRLFK